MSRGRLTDIFDVLSLPGGCCDCEIRCNVAESSRLKPTTGATGAPSIAAFKEPRNPGFRFAPASCGAPAMNLDLGDFHCCATLESHLSNLFVITNPRYSEVSDHVR
jgi:hypothetical protein